MVRIKCNECGGWMMETTTKLHGKQVKAWKCEKCNDIELDLLDVNRVMSEKQMVDEKKDSKQWIERKRNYGNKIIKLLNEATPYPNGRLEILEMVRLQILGKI